MTRYTADSRERVRDAVDMVALVSRRTDLRRAGANSYFGLCPFHDERTPSFHVSPQEKLYHCFGCEASGDPFRFVMETEGLDFTGALEALADRFGVALEREAEDPRTVARRERRERLQALLARAAAYYARYLWEAEEAAPARDYLARRGLGERTLREFSVGYAPRGWQGVVRASRAAGFDDGELLAAGLAQRSREHPGRVHDRFRERIMFPARDARGRVLGFGARAMREDQRPKYLNSPDGELYHKREVLYGIDLARAPAARAARIVLVEGYTDVIALHQAGIRNAVGIMGTSLTEEQVRELARVARVLELCLDADRAGVEAMVRAARLAAGKGLELRVVALPEGADPAELVQREGAAAMRARVEGSVPFAAFEVERILARAEVSSAEGRDRALAQLRPVLAEVPVSVLREELLRRIAGRLELSEAMLASLLARPTGTRSAAAVAGGGAAAGGAAAFVGPAAAAGPAGARSASAAAGSVAARPADPGTRSERTFLALCVALPEAGRAALAALDPDELLTSSVLRRAARHIASRTDAPLAELPPEDEELARAVADLVGRAARMPDVSEARLEHARLVLERDRLDRAIRRARARGDARIAELAREREQVLEAIHGVAGRLERVA